MKRTDMIQWHYVGHVAILIGKIIKRITKRKWQDSGHVTKLRKGRWAKKKQRKTKARSSSDMGRPSNN